MSSLQRRFQKILINIYFILNMKKKTLSGLVFHIGKRSETKILCKRSCTLMQLSFPLEVGINFYKE